MALSFLGCHAKVVKEHSEHFLYSVININLAIYKRAVQQNQKARKFLNLTETVKELLIGVKLHFILLLPVSKNHI